MRIAAKVDANQSAIAETFRAMGASVLHLHGVGQGCPDILVGWRGMNLLVECKDGSKPPSRRKLTADQQVFHAHWRGQVAIVESVNAAVDLLKKADRMAGGWDA